MLMAKLDGVDGAPIMLHCQTEDETDSCGQPRSTTFEALEMFV
jgi:hypothetical protein